MDSTMETQRTAFTFLEMVMVIVVLSILAALAIPRLERDRRQEAIGTVLSAVRYTQHLALIDDKHDNNANWQRAFWTIRFQGNGDYFTIASNSDYGTNFDNNESAIDPINGKLMYSTDAIINTNESPNIFLNKRFGINSVDFSQCGGNGTRHIAFDYLGRPHKGVFSASNNYSTYLQQDCNITFSFEDSDIDPFTLHIEKETGFAYVVGQENN